MVFHCSWLQLFGTLELGTSVSQLPVHTLIGAIIGVGLTNAIVTDSSVVDALNIPKMISIFMSLILSPAIGFVIAGLMIFFCAVIEWHKETSSYSLNTSGT